MKLISKVLHAGSDDELWNIVEEWCDDNPQHGWHVHALVPACTASREQKLAGGFEPVQRTETVIEWKVVLVR